MLVVDAAIDNPNYSWDGKSQRYRNKETGRFISKEIVKQLSQQRTELVKNDLETISQLLLEGKINLRTWQTETAKTLKILHAQQYILGVGGQSNVGKSEYLEIGRELKVQYRYLQRFAADLRNGKMTSAQFKRRGKMYADSSKVSFFRGRTKAARDAGYTHGKRLLGIAEHCPDCLRHHARGVVPIADLIMPTQQCVCSSQCRCNILYLRLEDAIKRQY